VSVRVYYDTCVFLLQRNTAHPQCVACAELLDVSRIKWSVLYGELSRSEAPIGELLDAFEIACAQAGVQVNYISVDRAQEAAKVNSSLKRHLKKFGFHGRDWKHLMAALAGKTQLLLTDDRDFWNPAAKAAAGRPPDGPVRQLIRKRLGIGIELPSSGLQFLQHPT
jgi:hypothetical protein